MINTDPFSQSYAEARTKFLAAADSGLQGHGAMPGGVGSQAGFSRGGGRPNGWNQGFGQFVIPRVGRLGQRKILPVAVQVDVFMGGAAPP